MRLAASLWLLASIVTQAQITATPTSIAVPIRAYNATIRASRPAVDTPITVAGSGSWNLARGGTLSTACSAQNGYCFSVATTSGGTCGSLPTGSGPTTLYLCWRGNITSQLGVGTHTGTLTVGSTTINITLNVQQPRAYEAIRYRSGYPSGCSTTSGYPDQDSCAITDERPTSGAFVVPSVGGSYVDPQFGRNVTRLTSNNRNIQYAGISACSATCKYVLVNSDAGTVYVITRATAAETYTLPAAININFAAWDPANDEILWFFEGAALKYRNVSAATTTTAADYSSASGARPAVTTASMGGTVDITGDGWWAFRDTANSTTLCAVNLNGLTTGTQEQKTFCGSMSGLSLTDIDFTQITQVDRETNKRYVIPVAAPKSHVFSVSASGLTYEYEIPTGSADVSVEPHSDVGQDEFGRQVFFWQGYDPEQNYYYVSSILLNRGAAMTRPLEEGGGLRYLYPAVTGTVSLDAHFGCNWRGTCVWTPYVTNTINAYSITNVTSASPCQVTTSAAHGFSNGASVGVANVGGTLEANGIFTISNATSTTFTLDGTTCTGTYTASTGRAAANTGVTNYSHRSQIILSRFGADTRPIAVHRSRQYGNVLNSYFATPRASVSMDGCWVVWASNYGVPETSSVYIARTGACSSDLMRASVDPADTSAVFNFTLPQSAGPATVTVSAVPGLGSPVVNSTDAGGPNQRQHVATGLTADTSYYYRIVAGEFSAAGQFRTLPTLSSTGRVVLSKAGGGTLNYGPTSALGSSCASPCSLAPSKGVLYHNATGYPQAVVVR